MSKLFTFQPVLGPVVSVRNHRVSPRAIRSKRRSWFSTIRSFANSASSMGSMAVYGLVVILGGLVASYIFMVNGSAAKGYEMRKIQNRIAEQDDVRHSLEIRAAEFASLGAINEAATSANLVSVNDEEFLTPRVVTAMSSTK